MTDTTNHTDPAPLPSPSRRLHELTMAMATRSVAAKVESLTVKRATVGDLKGDYVLEGLTLVRDEDDTLEAFMQKAQVALHAAHKLIEGMNSLAVRQELGNAGEREALQAIRDPEGVEA